MHVRSGRILQERRKQQKRDRKSFLFEILFVSFVGFLNRICFVLQFVLHFRSFDLETEEAAAFRLVGISVTEEVEASASSRVAAERSVLESFVVFAAGEAVVESVLSGSSAGATDVHLRAVAEQRGFAARWRDRWRFFWNLREIKLFVKASSE